MQLRRNRSALGGTCQPRWERRSARHVSDVPTVLPGQPSEIARVETEPPPSSERSERHSFKPVTTVHRLPSKRQRRLEAEGSQLGQGLSTSTKPHRHTNSRAGQLASDGEPVDKPGSVASNHSSRAAVADCLLRPTRDRRGPRHRPPIWPCSRRECLAGPVARTRGALLPHPFTLAGRANGWRSALCCTCRRLAPPRDYLAPCPVEPGLSSSRPVPRTFRPNAGRRRAVA